MSVHVCIHMYMGEWEEQNKYGKMLISESRYTNIHCSSLFIYCMFRYAQNKTLEKQFKICKDTTKG